MDALAQIYLLVLTNLEGWVDVSGPLCARLAGGGKLLGHVNELKYLGQLATEKSEVNIMYVYYELFDIAEQASLAKIIAICST